MNPTAGTASARAEPFLAPGDALLVVDVQRDFLPGGRLAVPRGDAVLGPLQQALDCVAAAGLPVFASRDWHPADHVSFTAQGGRWPPHCVAGSEGAAFAEALHWPAGWQVVSKASLADREAYSAFDGTDLHERLRTRGVQRLWVAGLATDYCVLASVLDALSLGYRVLLLTDAIAAVDLAPGDGARAIARMREAGAELTTVAGALAAPAHRARD